MSDDWRDRQVARLERDMTALRGDMWALEADVRDRFWKRDMRLLQFAIWLLVALIWAEVGFLIARAAIKG